jgi:hypothetical protein
VQIFGDDTFGLSVNGAAILLAIYQDAARVGHPGAWALSSRKDRNAYSCLYFELLSRFNYFRLVASVSDGAEAIYNGLLDA